MGKKIYRYPHYYPKRVVWEITYLCNLNCLHCGSAAGAPEGEAPKARPNELSLEEAFSLIDQLAELHTEHLTLSGGEPLMRRDWFEIAKYAKKKGIILSLITNGSLVPFYRDKIAEIGFSSVGISVDGLKENHNRLRRRPWAFDKAIEAIKVLKELKIPTVVVTTVNHWNIGDLEPLYDLLVELDVDVWQVQIGIIEGRFAMVDELKLSEDEYLHLMRFLAKKKLKNPYKPYIYPGDNIGYFSKYDYILHQGNWDGCQAGLYVLGVEANGNIKGCLSIQPALMEGNPFVEGNIREEPLKKIWEDPNRFTYNRKFDFRKLKGPCRTCPFKRRCRAGCTATAYGATGDRYKQEYCAFAMLAKRKGFDKALEETWKMAERIRMVMPKATSELL